MFSSCGCPQPWHILWPALMPFDPQYGQSHNPSTSFFIDFFLLSYLIYLKYAETTEYQNLISVKKKGHILTIALLWEFDATLPAPIFRLYIRRLRTCKAVWICGLLLLIKIAFQTIRENEEQLKSIKKWGGQSSKNGLWDEIQRYKKLFIPKFGIVI